MHILYVSQYFPPETCAPAVRASELARQWVDRGHQVTVLTAFAHHPTGVKAPGDRWRLTRAEDLDGIRVVRTYVYATANSGTLRRMISYATFMLSAILIGFWRIRRPDVVIATSPQLLCGVAGYVLARLLGAPYVFEVRDLWPESIIAVDAMRENFVIRGLKRVAAFLYAHSDKIVTVGDGYRRGIHHLYGISPAKIDVVPNGVDQRLFQPGHCRDTLREQYGWGNRFVIMYLGTHGMAHALEHVLETAQSLSADPDKLFVFVGEGAEKHKLVKLAHDWNLPNVQFLDLQPRERVPCFYAACDLGVVTLRNTTLFQEVLPSKIFEYLAMERPVLVSVGGDARLLVERAGAGEYVPPGDVPAMADAIRRLAVDGARRKRMGRSGRRFVLEHFSRNVLADRYIELLKPLLPEPRTRALWLRIPAWMPRVASTTKLER